MGNRALLLVLLGALVGTGCRCPRLPRPPSPSAAGARVDPAGPYADDPRVQRLLAEWPLRVADALDRLELLTGLSFGDLAPEVALAALGDEGRAYDLRTSVVDGVRIPVLRVNLERIAVGAEDPDEVLVRGLAVAALETAVRRSGGTVPPWLGAAAGAAAGGALSQRIERLARDDVLAGREVVARVDPQAARQTEPTGLAVVLLLLERGGPDLVRRFLDAVAEGDPAVDALGRLARESGTLWASARRALEDRLADVDVRPWRLLTAAERALAETGRAGLLSAVEGQPPEAILDELAVLSARAAMSEGDLDAARAALRALPEDAASRLRDPREAAVLRLRVEAAPGGDPEEAALLLERLERDFPRTGEADRLRAELRIPESRAGGLASLRRLAKVEGLERLELATLVRYVDLLHQDHRDSAAQRVLDEAGERAAAPELAALAAEVARAQQTPSEPALQTARARVHFWAASVFTDDDLRRDVVETGTAAARILVERLGSSTGQERVHWVALLGETAGASSVGALAPAWAGDPALLAADLEALASAVRVPELEVWVRTHASEMLAPEAAARLFDALRLDLDAEWVREHPDETVALRSPDAAVRRAAFVRAAMEGQAAQAPTLVARFLADPAPGLRREAVRVAGEAGFTALVRAAVEDTSPWVRREACLALARTDDTASAVALRTLLGSDPAPSVRAAAASALRGSAPGDDRTAAALVAALGDEDPGVRQTAATALVGVPPARLKVPLLASLDAELARREPRGAVLLLVFQLLDRTLGLDLGYYPGMPPDEVRGLLARLRRPAAGPGR